MMKGYVLALAFIITALVPLQAQGDFGFDAPSGDESAVGGFAGIGSSGIGLSGRATIGGVALWNDLDSLESLGEYESGNLISGTLELAGKGSSADILLRFDFDGDGQSLFSIDEAYLRAYAGKFDLEAGVRKLTWGRADSMGPLDVVNPLDYGDLTVTDSLERKIAQPLVHGSYSLGQFTKIEGIVIPYFTPHSIATDGPWASAEYAALITVFGPLPETDTLEYAQGGVRLSTVISSVDFGFQYWYGNMKQPRLDMPTMSVTYDRYHQVGVDFAAVVATLNVRAEGGINSIADRGEAYVWSLGFDRDTFARINVNLQVNGEYRSYESSGEKSSARVTAQVSKSFFRDKLEAKTVCLWGIEEEDYLVMPSLTWTKDEIEIEWVLGVFGGHEEGELGQYGDKDYLKLSLSYSF
jgi:hypothetical protein